MNKKKTIYINGTLLTPLNIGSSVQIREPRGIRTTSVVQHYLIQKNQIYIETMNTQYILFPL